MAKDPDLSVFNHNQYPLEQHLEIFEDLSGQVTFDQILKNEHDFDFKKNTRKHLNYSITDTTFWLRFDIDYPIHSSNRIPQRTWYLEIDRAYLDTCELYIIDEDNQVQKLTADSSIPFQDRHIRSPTSVFPVHFNLGERKRIYIKVRNVAPLYFQVSLWRPEAFQEKSTIQQLGYGFFYGGMAIVVLYNLFLFISIRDINYLYYIFYIASTTLVELIEIGHGFQAYPPLREILNKSLLPSIGWVGWLSVLLFTMTYIETKKNHPTFHFIIHRLIIIMVFNILISPFINYQASLLALVYFSAIFIVLVPIVSLYSWIKGNRNAEYFTYATIFNALGITAYCLIVIDILPSSQLLITLFPLGIIIEALLFSFAIGDRITRAQDDVNKANQDSLQNLTRYQSLFEESKEGMYQIDINGKLIQSNNALAKMLGAQNAKQLLATPYLLVERCLTNGGFNLQEVLASGSHHSEFSFINRNEHEKWVNHSASVLKHPETNAISIEGIVIDITDRKEKESAQKASDEESYRNQQATKENQATTHFLSNMNHQIRASLHSILGFAEIQSMNSVRTKDTQALSFRGLDLSNQLLALINKILDYSKLDAQKLEVETLEVNLIQLLDSTIKPLISNTKQTSIKYNYPIPITVLSDPTRLQQCISEIMIFTTQTSKEKGFELFIDYDTQTRSLTVSTHFECLTNQIEPINEIFELFKQPESWKKTNASDAGLGLSLTHKLAKLLGGTLTITKPLPSNCIITLSLPMPVSNSSTLCQNEPARLKLLPNNKPNKDLVKLQGNVLLAEDNPVNQKIISKQLSKFGLNVIIANNGEEAISIANEHQINVILMDLNMPVMDGFEATMTLRKQKSHPPIFALTAENDPKTLEKCLTLGFEGHLEKPTDKQKIYDTLKTYTERKETPNANSDR